MVISPSLNASIMRVIVVVVLARARSSWARWRVVGSELEAAFRRLSISARISWGSVSRLVMWSQTTWSR